MTTRDNYRNCLKKKPLFKMRAGERGGGIKKGRTQGN